jgi:hypothetical protein
VITGEEDRQNQQRLDNKMAFGGESRGRTMIHRCELLWTHRFDVCPPMTGEEDRQNQQRGGEAVVVGNKMGFGGELAML